MGAGYLRAPDTPGCLVGEDPFLYLYSFAELARCWDDSKQQYFLLINLLRYKGGGHSMPSSYWIGSNSPGQIGLRPLSTFLVLSEWKRVVEDTFECWSTGRDLVIGGNRA